MKGFFIALETGSGRSSSTMVAYNMSHSRKKMELEQYPSPVVWRTDRPAVKSWALLERTQDGDLVAFLSQNGWEIEVAELIMKVYTTPTEDPFSFSNFKLPLILVSILIVVGYQYSKGGHKLDEAGAQRRAKRMKEDLEFQQNQFVESMKQRPRRSQRVTP